MNIANASLALTVVLLACSCRSSSTNPEYAGSLEAVDELSSHGQYTEALVAAEAYHQAHPGDAEGERQLRRAKAAVMLQQAREMCFLEKNVEALALVRQAIAVEPQEAVIADWEQKLLAKLAAIHTRNGDEFFASTNLEGAREEYEKALTYEPEDLNAKSGLTQVLVQINYRNGMAQDYYEDGVHLMGDYWLQQAHSKFGYVDKYKKDHKKAKANKAIVTTQLASERSMLASQLEDQGLWSGARNEYRIALLIHPESAEAKAGFERTRIEAGAEEKLREIDRMIRAKKFEQAEVAISAGLAVTQHQQDKFEGRRAEIEETRLEIAYQSALALESDQEYKAALAAFDQLLAKRDYYKDVLARRDTLKGYIEKAASLYEQALASTDPEVKLDLLRRITIFWPRYENVEQLIEQIKPATATPDQKP